MDNTCIVFCAGGFDGLLRPMAPGDFAIAADGGLLHTQALGIEPQVILGDFDSLGYVPDSSQVFPVEKDDTDAMLAIRLGLARGYQVFHIYGGLDGPRLDHTVANFQALGYLCRQGAWGYLIGNTYIATVLHQGSITFPAQAQGILSVFCTGAPAAGVTISGLHYGLENGSLTADFPLGVSNHFIGQTAAVTVRRGSLLLLWDRSNGLPLTRQTLPQEEWL